MSNTTHVCFRFQKGEDPENWFTVDSVTGKITTTKVIDRESPHVKDNIYKVTVYAVDNGMTWSCFNFLFMLSNMFSLPHF